MRLETESRVGPLSDSSSSPVTAIWTYEEIRACRVCGNTELEPIIDLGTQALTGVFPRTISEHVPAGPLELVRCNEGSKTCGLVQLRHSFPKDRLYGHDYGYRSGLNQSMVDHLHKLASDVQTIVSVKPGDIVLDIGSNDGTLLRAFDAGLVRVGMDPTARKFEEFYPAGVRIVPDFFSKRRFEAEFAPAKAKIVTSIAMFYDLEDPVDFMNQIRDVLADDGVWVFEQSYLPIMLDQNSYDTICHEHVEYYTFRQIEFMAHLAGLKVLDVETNTVNGGSFRVIAAKRSSVLTERRESSAFFRADEASREFARTATYDSFRQRVYRHRDELTGLLESLAERGNQVLGYGASTKGNVLLQFCGITRKHLACIADVNPDKFGCFTPQTGIPIVSEQDAKQMGLDAFLVLPWHFRPFIVRREAEFLSAGHQLIFPLPAIDIVRHA